MKKALLTTVLIFGVIALVQAQDITIQDIQIGTDVQDRAIVGADSVFADSVGQVYCFTHVTGAPAQDTTTITHVWYYNNEEKAQVDLNVRSSDWRTWSSKTILESWTGQWSVDILGPNGDIIATKTFRVGDQME